MKPHLPNSCFEGGQEIFEKEGPRSGDSRFSVPKEFLEERKKPSCV